MISYILSTTFSVTEIPPQRYSVKSQLLRRYSQFSFTKILKALNPGFNIYNILEERPKVLLKMFFIDADRVTLPRRPEGVIFEYTFKIHFYILVFSILTIGKHVDVEVDM